MNKHKAAVMGEGKAPRDTCVDVWADRRPPDDNGHRQFVLPKKDPRSEQQRAIDAATRKQYNSCQPGTYEEQQGVASEAPRGRWKKDATATAGQAHTPDEEKPSWAEIGVLTDAAAERDRLREQVKELHIEQFRDYISSTQSRGEEVKELLASRDKYEALANALFHERDELLAACNRVLDVITGDQAAELGIYAAIAKADSSRGEALREGRAS